MSENEEPKRLTPEQTKIALDLRERMKHKEFYRDIVEHFPKDPYYDHYKLSCGHWSAFSYASSASERGTTLCFRCVDAEWDKAKNSK